MIAGRAGLVGSSRKRSSLACAAAVALLAACATGPRRIALDGSPRFPDDEGVVTRVSANGLTLDGRRSYDVSENLRSFSALDLSIQPLVRSRGQYAQVGLDGNSVVWLGRIAAVVRTPAPTVFYVGRLARIDKGRAIFREGTVLRLAAGVVAPSGAERVQAEIDPTAHTVRRMRAA